MSGYSFAILSLSQIRKRADMGRKLRKTFGNIACFFQGMAHVLDIGAQFPSDPEWKVDLDSPQKADKKALEKTWKNVGSDLRKAMNSESAKHVI